MKSNVKILCTIVSILMLSTSCDVDDIIENNECNQPDLEFISGDIICPTHTNYQIGWQANIKNSGSMSGQVTVQAWLSNDAVLGSDQAAGGLVFGTANPGESITRIFGATVSNVDDYAFLLLQIDHNEQVQECNENNNLLVIEIPDNYSSSCGPDDFNSITCEDINFNNSNLSEDNIEATDVNGHILQVGDVIIYKTNQDRCGKLEILNIDDAVNKKLTIKAVTFNADGSVYNQTNALEIRGTWNCDLDAMIEEGYVAGQEDFWWQRINVNDTEFSPKNGAKFHKYSF